MLGKALKVLVVTLSLFLTNYAHSFTEKNELLNAVERGNHNHVKQLLKSGFSVNSKGFLGATALMKAALKGNEDMVKLLLDFGADVYVKDDGGATPLHYAVRAGNSKIVELLVKSGADVNVKDKLGFSPLKRASLGKNSDIIDILSESKYEAVDNAAKGDIGKIEDPTLQAMVSDKVTHNNFSTSSKKYSKAQPRVKRNFKNGLLNESDFLDEEVVKRADMRIEQNSIAPIHHEKIEVAELSKILSEQPAVDEMDLQEESALLNEIKEEIAHQEEQTDVRYEQVDSSDLMTFPSNSRDQELDVDIKKSDHSENLTDGIYVAEAQLIEDENDMYVPEPIPSNFEDKPEEIVQKKVEQLKKPEMKNKTGKIATKPEVVQDLAAKAKAMKIESAKGEGSNPQDESKFKKFKIANSDKATGEFKFSIVMDGFKNLDLAFKFWDQLSNLKEFSSARISLSFKERNGKEELVVIASYFPSNADAFAGCLRALRVTSGFACRPSQEY